MDGEARVASQRTPRLHGQTLVEMNRAAFTGRRDAALERLTRVLHREMTESPKQKRADLYVLCIGLLDEAVMATRRSQTAQDTLLVHYLQLLQDTVAASLALVRHEMRIARDTEMFSTLVGPDMVAELNTASDLFSRGEMNILDSIDDLLKFGGAIRERDTADRQQAFGEDDTRRYELALSEYRKFYRTYKPEKPAGRREGKP